jgi:hypothetical protein
VYRDRLGSLSWFMKCLNEPIARRANAEDHCSGHFWEARFHSQPLCSEQALLAAMAYVDLNPIRARMAETPETSDYTSIRARLRGDRWQRQQHERVVRMIERDELHHLDRPIRPLMGFSDSVEPSTDIRRAVDALPILEEDYLQLLDATGRITSHGQRGRIDSSIAPILERLGLSSAQWTAASTDFSQHYRNGKLRLKKTA